MFGSTVLFIPEKAPALTVSTTILMKTYMLVELY